MDEPAVSGEPFALAAETHSAAVFFAGDLAFKMKKPVNLGFLDFSSPQAREQACLRETELNRRFAPDVYLGAGQLRDPAGELIDHVVLMRRMPAGRRLSALVTAGEPVTGPLREVARILAAAHSASPRREEITAEGSARALRDRWRANASEARAQQDSPPDPEAIDAVEQLAERFLAGREPLLTARMDDGRIVDGHGDLLAGDIFCLDDGPRILDCLEFDDRLRWLDGLDDAACLAMDLERLGQPALGDQFIGWYRELTGDRAPSSLHHHYVAYRAFMRAKVAGLRCAQGDTDAAAQADSLTGIALRHLQAGEVTLVLVGGPPGTGKSTLSARLADALGFTVLSSDRIRKELAGLAPDHPSPARYGEGIYTAGWTERTYAELLRRAAVLLGNGEPVIADASWNAPRSRASAAQVADSAAARLVQLRCTLPPALAAERVRARGPGPSDADIQIARAMEAGEAPWPEALAIDTSSAERALQQAAAATRPARGQSSLPAQTARSVRNKDLESRTDLPACPRRH